MASSRVGTRIRARARWGAVPSAEAGEHRQAEGEGLARAGAAAAEDVAAGEGVGDRGGLDRERVGDAVPGEPLDEHQGHPEGGEAVVLGHLPGLTGGRGVRRPRVGLGTLRLGLLEGQGAVGGRVRRGGRCARHGAVVAAEAATVSRR